jgi:soluble lytic murein transglycosylase
MARASNEDDRFLSTLAQIREASPTSSWLEQALLTAGNMFLLRNDYDRAIDSYREIVERFPQGKLAPYAHWKVAWLNLRQGRVDIARKGFEEQIALYPASQQVPAAVYWRARLAEEEQNSPKARIYYQKLSQRFRNYYYAELARQRLQDLTHSGQPSPEPVLEKIPPIQLTSAYTRVEPPADDLRAQKAQLLQNGGLTEFAIRELRMASEEGGESWATAEMARLYRDNGQYYRALQVLKRAVPSYFAMDLEALPRPYWEDLFPRPWWTDVKKYSSSNGLDPFLVASLIRQESEFNPDAISHANAWGLMQVLPSTGKKLAHSMKVRRFSNEQLLMPEMNLQLGTRYFRELVDHFSGHVEYALAAYNAGTDRVETWLANGKYRDAQEFVESIPFTETREYVQSVLRNATVYKRLYGTP